MVQKTLYNVWIATLSLWESVIGNRINLQQMKLELKLNSVLNDQVMYRSLLEYIIFMPYFIIDGTFTFFSLIG